MTNEKGKKKSTKGKAVEETYSLVKGDTRVSALVAQTIQAPPPPKKKKSEVEK